MQYHVRHRGMMHYVVDYPWSVAWVSVVLIVQVSIIVMRMWNQ